MAGAIIGAIAGGAAGDASSGMASAAQYQASKHERNIAWRRQQRWEQIQPSLRVQGLRDAGINPMVGFLGGGAAGGSHFSPQMATTGGTPSFSRDTASRAISTSKQAAMMEDQVATVRAQRSEAESKALAAKFLPEKSYHEAGAAGEIWSKLSQETQNLIAQRGLTGAHQAQSEATKAKLEVERLLMQLGLPGARAMEDLYQKHPWLRQVREFGGGGLVGTAVGGAGAAAVGAAGYLQGKRTKPSSTTKRRK